MRTNCLVSILVPVFNAEKFLGQCVDSLLNQTYKNIEVILVDDGSTDQSGKICDYYATKDSKVRVVHKQNAGVAEARITAFENCKGEYVCFVDADDYVAATFVEQMLNKALSQNADIVCCGHYIVHGNQQKVEHHSMKGQYDRTALRKAMGTCLLYDRNTRAYGMTVYLWGKLIHSNYVGEALMQGKGLWFAEDQIALFHALYRINILFVMDTPLYYYVQHEKQVSRRYDFSLWETQAECWRRYQQIDTDHLLGDQLYMRIWKTIYLNCKYRMKDTVRNYKEFGEEINRAKSIGIIAKFFKKPYLNDSLQENIKFWMLKYRLYRIYYNRIVMK